MFGWLTLRIMPARRQGGAANVLIAFSSSGQEMDVDTIGLLYDTLQGAADAMDGVAESIRREDGGEER